MKAEKGFTLLEMVVAIALGGGDYDCSVVVVAFDYAALD